MEEKLRKYIESQKLGNIIGVKELIDGNSSNHLNYKIGTSAGTYVARVTKPGDVLGYSNLSDEYVILKLTEKYDIGPKAISIDLEGFESPLLIEEFLDGTTYSDLANATQEIFEKTIDLLVETSNVSISINEFSFKFSYGTFKTNFKVWNFRLKEIEELLGKGHLLVSDFKRVTELAQKILEEKDVIMKNTPKEFIYNDVHPGNIFWIDRENKAKFVDWQKVSTGNPAFMIALFARRFGHLWGMNQVEFSKKVFKAYQTRKNIADLEELFHASILERAVSDMIWSVWADVKKSISIKVDSAEENIYYEEALSLMSEM
jgi:aminoglycoside phosphotransferase (APT) family kinase protein